MERAISSQPSRKSGARPGKNCEGPRPLGAPSVLRTATVSPQE